MKLFVFGLGYTAGAFATTQIGGVASVAGTSQSDAKVAFWKAAGVEAYRFGPDFADAAVEGRIEQADTLLVSVQPNEEGDPVLRRFGDVLARSSARRVVYLSTIGVYGDHDGGWIDESASTAPSNPRQVARLAAERAWIDFGKRHDRRVAVLRLAGIYGPGRNALDDLAAGEARRIDKPGQVFNRIHVADIGSAIAAAFRSNGWDGLVNVTDDEPAPAPDVVAYAASLMGCRLPPLIPFAEAALSPMARSFYGANRRVANKRLKEDLGVRLAYPTYREGLSALWQSGEGQR